MSETVRDFAERIRSNGYMPLPLVPFDKAIRIEGWSLLAAQDKYDELWKNAPANCNIGNYCGQLVIIADFDAKGENPSIKVYEWLKENSPKAFDGAIIEKTPSGGIHLTFKWTSCSVGFPRAPAKGKTFGRFFIEGKTYDVELLTRGAQAVMPPSHVKKYDKSGNLVLEGDYEYLSEQTHLNTRRYQLPEIPEILTDSNNIYINEVRAADMQNKTPARRETRPFDDLSSDELDLVMDTLIDVYLRNARDGHRHFQALGLACNIAGIRGMSRSDVERSVDRFFDHASRPPNSDSEINGIVRFGLDHADRDPFIPEKTIRNYRKNMDVEASKKRRAMNAQTE